MYQNSFLNDYYRVVNNNATSYFQQSDGIFLREVEYWSYVGSGNIHSTTNDMLKWQNNFSNPQTNWEDQFKLLTTLDKLNDGSENDYAFGLRMQKLLGYDIIKHSGTIGGFNTYAGTCPDEKLSIVLLTNFSSSSPDSKARQIYEILLPKLDGDNSETVNKTEAVKTITLSNDELKKYESHYWNDKNNYSRKIYLRNDTLRYFRSATSETPIIPIGNDEFQMLTTSDVNIKFVITKNQKSMIFTQNNGKPSISQGYEARTVTTKDLLSYTGKFYSPELETTYSIYLNHDTLYWHHSRHGDFKMKVLKSDVLEGEWPMLITKYKRDKKGKVTGFYVSNGRVRNLWFEKQK